MHTSLRCLWLLLQSILCITNIYRICRTSNTQSNNKSQGGSETIPRLLPSKLETFKEFPIWKQRSENWGAPARVSDSELSFISDDHNFSNSAISVLTHVKKTIYFFWSWAKLVGDFSSFTNLLAWLFLQSLLWCPAVPTWVFSSRVSCWWTDGEGNNTNVHLTKCAKFRSSAYIMSAGLIRPLRDGAIFLNVELDLLSTSSSLLCLQLEDTRTCRKTLCLLAQKNVSDFCQNTIITEDLPLITTRAAPPFSVPGQKTCVLLSNWLILLHVKEEVDD